VSTEPATNFKKLILLNGPPGVGKDEAAQTIRSYLTEHAQWLQATHIKMSEPHKKAAHAIHAVFESWDHYDRREYQHLKETPNDDFLGLSPREAYIEMSNALKKLHGEKALGYIMRRRLVQLTTSSVFIISDTGFVEEMEPIIHLVDEKNVMLIELSAIGKDFSKDSRGYIGDELKQKYPKITVRKIENTFGDMHDKALFQVMCKGAAKKFLQINDGD
jgi:DNA polymerase III delta prime subunit